MMIVNRDGTVHRHQKIDGEIVELEPLHNPDIVAPIDPVETVAHSIGYWFQTWREFGNPAEMVFEQGEGAPKLSDYIDHPQSKQTERPLIDRKYARHKPNLFLPSHNSIGRPYISPLSYYQYQTSAISAFASISGTSGFDMAGKMLNHHLKGSGDTFEIPVDEMLADVLGFRQSILDYVGFELGTKFASSNVENSSTEDIILEEVGHHTVFAFPLEWRQVGIGADDDIFGFDGDMPATPDSIVKLLQGIPLDDDATQEAYDWFLALGKFYYYPRVTVLVDNITGNADVGLVIDVQDHYNWHAGAGPLDSVMAQLETVGYGKNFQVFGQSSPIIGRLNLNDVTMKNELPYFQLKIDKWDDHE
ncbi:MAG: hypothetical protein J4G18_08900 [Anaerolineae bacterium]|nr:hypothetical protein [Anaerolineae bacterium]